MSAERKEWVRVSVSPTATMVSVTLQEGNTTVKWTVKTYASTIAQGRTEARAGATKALDALVASG